MILYVILIISSLSLIFSIDGDISAEVIKSKKSNNSQQTEKAAPTAIDSSDTAEKDLLISKAKEVIQKYKLTTILLECLIFEASYNGKDEVSLVEVRELHNEHCIGDPFTSPRLFTLRINLDSREVWTDANSITGEFEKLE